MTSIGIANNADNNQSIVVNTLAERFAAIQDQGNRANQEDDYGMMDGRALGANGSEHTLLVLTDGMGGHSGGEVASSLVTEALIDAYQIGSAPVSDQLRTSVDVANNKLGEVAAASEDKHGMGCTAVAAVITKQGLEWISVGDSPMWLFSDGVLIRLNADHSMAPVLANLVEVGRMDAEEAASDPKRHALRSAVTGDDIDLIDQSSQPISIGEKDLLILASDGLQTLSEDELAGLLKKHGNEALQTLAERMIMAVKEKHKPNQDNTTILLYRPDGNYGIVPNPAMSSGNLCHDKQEMKSNIADNSVFTDRRRVCMRYIVLGVVLIVALVMAYWVNRQTDEDLQLQHTNQVTPEGNTPQLKEFQATEQTPIPTSPEAEAEPEPEPEPEQEESGEASQQETMNDIETNIAPSSLKTPTNLKSDQTE